MANVRSLNRVILVGRVGQKPEISHIPSLGRDVAKFSLATNEGYMDKNNEWKETTEWHNIVAWGPVVKKIDRSVEKGMLLLIEGKLKSRKWKDKDDQSHSRTEIEISTLVVLEKTNKGNSFEGRNRDRSGHGRQYNEDQASGDMNGDSGPAIPEKDINDTEFPYDEGDDPF